jgi:hypothetical protein
MEFFIRFLLVIYACSIQSRPVIYGAFMMNNPEKEHTALALADAHYYSDDCSEQVLKYAEKLVRQARQQQQDIVTLAHAQKAHVIAEDTGSFLKKKHKIDQTKIDAYNQTYNTNIIFQFGLLNTLNKLWVTPLQGLEEACTQTGICVSNVEFRDGSDQLYTAHKKEIVRSQFDAEIVQKIQGYYKNISQDSPDGELDLYILHEIKSHQHEPLIVAAGGSHIASIARILHQYYGYTNITAHTPDGLPVDLQGEFGLPYEVNNFGEVNVFDIKTLINNHKAQ